LMMSTLGASTFRAWSVRDGKRHFPVTGVRLAILQKEKSKWGINRRFNPDGAGQPPERGAD
jgi:hypothetical protein